MAGPKNITCSSRWILVPQLLDGLHITLINEIIIIDLSGCIEFNFDWPLNTIEFSIRITFFYSFLGMQNESKFKWKTLKIINVIVNLF